MSGEGGTVDARHEYTSDELGVTVRFHKPLRTRHYDAYQQVLETKDDKGNPVGSDLARRFAATLVLIDEWESADGRYPRPDKSYYEEGDLALVWWLAQVGMLYVNEVRVLPFRSSKPAPDTPEATEAPPTS